MQSEPDVYDVVKYPTFAYANTHPSRLAAMAILHGLQPAPVSACRVLEIGCNAGTNLIPMAYAMPESKFVGFDLASAPIAHGQQRIQELGLVNVRLVQADLAATDGVPELEGKFDYIIAHGVYTWVPDEVRSSLLALCRDHLAEHGVAFLSYAALPGGHLLLMAREMMTYKGIDPERPAESVREAMEFLRFIASCRPAGDGYRVLLERYLETIGKRSPEGTFHDELATFYQPVLFSDFARRAAQHGLRYFGEAEMAGPVDPSYQPETATAVRKMAGGHVLVQEQILDFARMRQYRESLVCHEQQTFTHDIDPDGLRKLRVSCTAESSEGEVAGMRIFTSPAGLRIESHHPATIVLMEHLISRYPESVAFAELARMLEQEEGTPGMELPMLVLRLLVARMIEVEAWEAPVASSIAERPYASRLCRHDLLQSNRLVTILHSTIELTDPVASKLVPMLDGTRDRTAILRDLSIALPEMAAQDLAQGLEPALAQLRRVGVLEQQRT